MPINPADRRRAGKQAAKELFVQPKRTADLDWDDLENTIQAIDDWMESDISTHTTGTVLANLIAAFPPRVRATTSNEEKAVLLNMWALTRTGQLPPL